MKKADIIKKTLEKVDFSGDKLTSLAICFDIAMEEYAELKVKEALESKPVENKHGLLIFDKADLTPEQESEIIEKFKNHRHVIFNTPAIDLEDFLKWYKPNHKLFYYSEPSNIIAKYNEDKQNENE